MPVWNLKHFVRGGLKQTHRTTVCLQTGSNQRVVRRWAAWMLACAVAGAALPWSPDADWGLSAETVTSGEGADAASSLRELLTQADANSRLSAVLEIGAMGSQAGKASDLLLDPLHDSDSQVRACAAMVLLKLGAHRDAALVVVQDMLNSPEAGDRSLAAFVAGESGVTDTDAKAQLEKCLADEAVEARLHAAEALLKTSPSHPEALAVVLKALASSDTAERAFAIHVLGGLPTAPSTSVAHRVAVLQADSDADIAAGAAVNTLLWSATRESHSAGRISAQRMEQIARLLEAGPVLARRAAAVRMGTSVPADSRLAEVARAQLTDTDPLIRSCAALALGGTGTEEATERTLLEMLDSGDPSQMIPALGAIGRMPVVSRQVHETVIARQQTGIAGVDILAATVVAGVEPSDAAAITTLVRAAEDESPEVRTLALRALQLTKWREHEGAETCIRTRSGDENLRVRAAAEQTLATPEVQPVVYEEVAAAPQGETPEQAADAPAPVNEAPGRAVVSPPPSQEDVVTERRFSERRIRDISATLGPIQMPGELSPRQMLGRPGLFHQLGVVRGNPELVCLWTPPLVRHQPLYFEEVSLERYGYHYGCVQSVISGAKFGANVALLPLKVIGQPPCSTEYSVGYDRPGNCAEAVCDGIRLCTPHECDDGPEDTIIPQYQVCP